MKPTTEDVKDAETLLLESMEWKVESMEWKVIPENFRVLVSRIASMRAAEREKAAKIAEKTRARVADAIAAAIRAGDKP